MKILSLLLNIFNIVLLPGSVSLTIPLAMIFDSPESEKKDYRWAVRIFSFFPVVSILSLVVGWWKWHEGDYKTALIAGAVAPIYLSLAFAGVCSKAGLK